MLDDSIWLWDAVYSGGIGRSVDGCLSRSFMGALGPAAASANGPFGLTFPGALDASLDVHTGRRVLVLQPASGYTAEVFSFTFDEKPAPASAAHLIPIPTWYLGGYNNVLNLNLINSGGDWANDVTIKEITATNGVTFTTEPLPWNIGAIPAGSTPNWSPSSEAVGEISFNANIPSGVHHFDVKISGTYNGAHTFQTKTTLSL